MGAAEPWSRAKNGEMLTSSLLFGVSLVDARVLGSGIRMQRVGGWCFDYASVLDHVRPPENTWLAVLIPAGPYTHRRTIKRKSGATA